MKPEKSFVKLIIILLSESFDPRDFGMTSFEKMRMKGVVYVSRISSSCIV